MRVNEVLARVHEDELIDIRRKSQMFYVQGTKGEIIHSDKYMNNHVGDMIVTHIRINTVPERPALMLLVD
nr:MAG TPA: hypothetical protein [Caudoviricetes sp.]